jgi:hypothetical protein
MVNNRYKGKLMGRCLRNLPTVARHPCIIMCSEMNSSFYSRLETVPEMTQT